MSELRALALGVVASGFTREDFDRGLPPLAGYVLFARNGTGVEQVRSLTDALRARHGALAPLIAIDQEGGRVARLDRGIEVMPSMMALGAVADIELSARAGEQVAFDLRRAGCTIDLAPVLDLALQPRNTVIGTRAIGADPGEVAEIGSAFARGLQSGGILPCYKHFPGHGSTDVDSHYALPAIEVDEATLRARDLAPFAAVAAGAPMIMGAHVIARAFDASVPATLSHAVVTGLLRDELGFGGVFATDCLEMGAVADGDGSVNSAVMALAAGADLMLISHSIEVACAAVDAIEAAVERGIIPRARLEQAYERVTRLREAGSPPLALDARAPHPGVGCEVARRAITLVRGVAHADPTASYAIAFADRPLLSSEVGALPETVVTAEPSPERIDAVLATLHEQGRRPILLARRAHLHDAQARAIATILERYPDAVVVSMLEPFDVACFTGARHVLATYGDEPPSVAGLADVLFGRSMPEGRMPVDLGALHR